MRLGVDGLLALAALLATFGCAAVPVSKGGAGTYDYEDEGFRFTYLVEVEPGRGRSIRGLISPRDYRSADHVTPRGGKTFIAVDHHELEFPPGKDFAVVSEKGEVRFLSESLSKFCPDEEDEKGTRYGLKIERLKSSPIWKSEILPGYRTKRSLVLEDFETPSPRYLEKFGKRFVSDPAIVSRGTHCLEWRVAKGENNFLQIKTIPRNVQPYIALSFWMKNDYPVEIEVLAMNPSPTANPDSMRYAVSHPAGLGWTNVEMPLARFKPSGAATFAAVESLVIQLKSSIDQRIYLDEVILVGF